MFLYEINLNMRIFFLFPAFICFNSLIASNLVKNPGFEDSEISPKNWIISGPVKSFRKVVLRIP